MKRKLLKKRFAFLAIIGLASMQLSAQIVGNVEIFSSSLNGWAQNFANGTSGDNGTVTWADAAASGTTDGALKLVRITDNANFGFKLNPEASVGINATNKKVIKMRYKNGSKANQIRIGGKNGNGVNVTTSNFTIVADAGVNTNGYVTAYFDMTSNTSWIGELTNFWIGVRQNFAAGEGDFYLDKIEFINSLPPDTYNEFIRNPGFEDLSGIAYLSGTSVGASRSISTTEFHDGTQSLKFDYSVNATANFWTFSSYEGDYAAAPKSAGTIAVVKMWVKTNRTTPFTMQARLKLTNLDVENAIKPILSVNTTKTDGSWEELTFNISCPDAFDGASLWFNVLYDDANPAGNLKAGEVVYIDDLSATFDTPTLLVSQNALEGVSVYPNPVSDVLNVNAPVGSVIEVYNTLGAVVKSAKGTNTVSVSDLASGLYLLKVTNNGKTYQDKIVKK